MIKLPCPSCAAEVKFQSAISVFAVCEYCQSTLVRRDLNIESLGKMAIVKDEWSPMQRGTEGWVGKDHFALVGRLKLTWERGNWNEWFALFDSQTHGWLSEAQGFYCVSFPVSSPPKLPAAEELTPGKVIRIEGANYTVDDIKSATCDYSEGELPFIAEKGRRSISVDLSTQGGKFACIDYSSDGVALYVGSYYKFDELKFTRLRELEGW